jgi:formylglycine-generating enzyme required for sulfatase activity
MIMLTLVPTLTEAQPAARCSSPLSEGTLTTLLKGSVVPEASIKRNLASCGIDFEPDDGAIGRLRSAGASETVLAAVRAATGPAARKRQAEQAFWDSIKDSRDAATFEDYLGRYPGGQFAAEARQKYQDLKLAAGQWDTADGRIRDLLRVVPENDEIRGWQRSVADGREAERKQKEAAAALKAVQASWESIKDSRDPQLFEQFLREHPASQYAGAARQKLAALEPATIAAGTMKVNPNDGLTYVWIPPGTFMMGCSPKDSECFPDEMPAHQRVTGRDPSYRKGARLPVETVNWSDAQSYCSVIGGRLPTEAEWEYAARAGSTGARYGDLNEIAWYSEDSGGRTHEVAQKAANAWGLYDMLGNVFQWTADWYGDYPSGGQSDPSGPASGQHGALRGGAWGADARFVRVSDRYKDGPGYRVLFIGFRCVGESPAPVPVAPASAAPDRPVASASVPAAPSPMPVAPVIPPVTTAAGTRKVNPKDGLTYVWIPPGTFMMGCSPGDNECFPDEKPAHQVTITKGYWLGQTPVTQQAYQRVTGQDPSHFKGANLPVETVNWNEAQSYCSAIGGRLPTEAEWEYAARAGSTGARYGNLDEIAWYAQNSGSKTHEVAQKAPNAWGLYDMLGNLWQSTADRYGDYQSGAQSDPPGAVGDQYRALRGGSWSNNARYVRVSDRDGGGGGRVSGIGLRCVGESTTPAPAAPGSSAPDRPAASGGTKTPNAQVTANIQPTPSTAAVYEYRPVSAEDKKRNPGWVRVETICKDGSLSGRLNATDIPTSWGLPRSTGYAFSGLLTPITNGPPSLRTDVMFPPDRDEQIEFVLLQNPPGLELVWKDGRKKNKETLFDEVLKPIAQGRP